MKDIREIGVVGEGKMGTSIFHYMTGFDFILNWICSSEPEAEKAQRAFNKKMKFQYQSGILDESEYNFKTENTRIGLSPDILAQSDLIIEAITEDIASKISLLGILDRTVKPGCVFTSNSSSIPPSRLGQSGIRKDKIAGLHFFFPVPFKNTVELIVNSSTSLQTKELLERFLLKIKKKVFLQKEPEVFLLNRLFLDFQATSFQIAGEGKITKTEIDTLVKKYLFPIGVFEFFDHVGIDIMLASIKAYTGHCDNPEFYEPMIMSLEEMVARNKLGIKTKEGFYDYSNRETSGSGYTDSESVLTEYNSKTIKILWESYISSVNRIIDTGKCSRADLAGYINDYMGMDKDPFTFSFNG